MTSPANKSASPMQSAPQGKGGAHTPGPWRTDPEFDNFTVLARNGVMVADCGIMGFRAGRSLATNQANARLIAAAVTAPHECGDPNCPGAINKRKLDAHAAMLEALEAIYAECESGPIQGLRQVIAGRAALALAKGRGK